MAEQLTIRISAQSQEAEAALKRVTQNIQQLSQTARQAGANITRGLSLSSVTAFAERASASLKRLEQNLSQLSSRLAAVSAAWAAATTAFGAGALKAGMELERLQLRFRILTGSAQGAREMLEGIRQLSEQSVFDFKTLAEAAGMVGSQLKAAGGDINQLIPLLAQMQALVRAFGETTPEALEGVARAIAQILAKGRVQMEEIIQLNERMIPALQLMAKGMGVTVEQLREMMEKGLAAGKALEALFRGAREEIQKSGEIKTFAMAFSNLRQNMWDFFANLGVVIGEQVKPHVQELADRIKALAQSNDFKIFAQSVANAAVSIVKGLIWIVDHVKAIVHWFAQLPDSVRNALSLLFVGGPFVTGAVAGIMKIGSYVVWLARLFTVDLIGAIGRAVGALAGFRAAAEAAGAVGGAGAARAAGAGAGAAVASRFLGGALTALGVAGIWATMKGMEEIHRRRIAEVVTTGRPLPGWSKEVAQRAHEIFVEEARKRKLPVVPFSELLKAGRLEPAAPEAIEAFRRLRQQDKAPISVFEELAQQAWEKAKADVMGKRAEREFLQRWLKDLKLGVSAPPAIDKEAEKQRKKAAEEAKKQAVDALQDQLHLTQQLIKVEEFRFERLLKEGQFVEAERALRERLLPLLNKQSEIELRLEQTRKGRLTDADRQAQFVERQRKTEELLARLEDARQRQAEKLVEQAREELAFQEEIRREVEAQAEAALRVWEHFQQVELTLKKLDIADLQDAFETALSEGRLQGAANLLEQIKTKVNELAQAEIQFRLQQAELQGEVLTEQEKELIQREVMREATKQVEAATKALQRAEEAAAEAARRHAAERAKLLQTMQQELLTLQERLLRQRLEALPPEMRPQADILETLRQTSLALAKMRADAQLMQDILLDPVAAMIRWGAAIQKAKAEWDEFIAKLRRDAAEVRERVREMMEQAAAERARIPVIMAEAEEERAKAILETLRAQGATRQQLREAEIALLQATQKRLEAERASLQALMQQLSVKYAMRFLDLMAAKTQQEAAQALQAMATIERQIAETRAQMVKLDAQILSTQIEIARANPFEQFRQGIEDAVRRFEDALADWLAGVARLRDAFRNLWIDSKRQFWRVVVQETLSPLLNWVRAWARQLGEAIFGGILRQPVLTAGLVPTGGAGGGIGLPLPTIKLPPVAAGAGAAVAAAAMGANKELSALTGAAVGFAVGGPVGAVIGGLAGLLFGGRKKKSAPAPAVPPAIPLGAAVYGPSINLSTAVTLQVDGRELGRVMVRQVV
jgi:tape measure domain-containing protein